MAVTKKEYEEANARMAAKREGPIAVAACYDRARGRVVISLSHDMEFVFPAVLAEGLAGAAPADLAEIEITPSGLGLNWPRLDADLYLPALLAGVFGTKRWMAGMLGAAGGRSRSESKAAASRENGRRGGRPRKRAL